MTTYQLYLRLGADQHERTITADDPADLAAAVHQHARGILGSSRCDVQLGDNGHGGTIRSHGAEVGVFTVETAAETVAAESAATDGIRYGWTLSRLDALARAVVAHNRAWWPAGDRDDLHAAAWHGIVEALYTATNEPRRSDLMEAGRRALVTDVRDTMRHRGDRRDGTNNGAKHAQYWQWAGRAVPSHENRIVERTALEQILPALTPGQRRALAALAATGDYREAERLMGTKGSLKSQLMLARRRFRGLWHEGETPSGHWGVDRRAGTVRGTVGHGSAVARIRRRARSAS